MYISEPFSDFKYNSLAQLIHVADKLFPLFSINISYAHQILETAYNSVQAQYSIEDAVAWAGGFVMPPEVHDMDFKELVELGYDLPELIRRKQARNKHSRLSLARLHDLWDSTDPDFDTLCEFARDGVHVMTDSGFVPRREDPKGFSPKYSVAYPAVNKLIYDSHKADLAVILPSSCIPRLPAELPIHKSRLGHTLKKGKPQGRVTCNYSYGKPHSRLNTAEVKEMARERYGDIQLSTVTQMALMILKQLDHAKSLGRGSEDLILWKMDLKGAFTLLFFKPADCGLLVLPMTDQLSYIPIAGNFGLTIFPFVFNVISRSLLRAILLLLIGLCLIYIDDLQGCCLKEHVLTDIDTATLVITNLLGDDAVAEDKTETGRVIDWIGWQFDLDTMTVSIADHNYYKTLYGFLSIRRGQRVQVHTLHTLASWASRYTFVCPYMTPFSGYLYSAFSGYSNQEAYIKLPDSAYLVVVLWRCFFFLMKLDLREFSRPLEEFRPQGPAEFLLEVDGCPMGIGIFIHERIDGEWSPIFAVSWCDEYDLQNDSRYQNSMEFISAVMGLATLGWLGHFNKRVEVLGDNTTSLSWLEAMKFRPGASTSAALAYILLHKQCGYSVVSTEFVPGENNLADPLSRGTLPSHFGFDESHSFTQLSAPPIMKELSALLNPSIECMEESFLLNHWAMINSILNRLTNP